MKTTLVLGGTGKLGKVVIGYLLNKNWNIIALTRNPEKLNIVDKKLIIIKGDVTNKIDLENNLKDVNLVISVLGHGFRTSYPIQEKTLINLIPLMSKNKTKRFITVTGAALKTKSDAKSVILFFTGIIFKIIDPYRMQDAEVQQNLLEKSNLDWTVIRTPIHDDGKSKRLNNVGYKQPQLWNRISRVAIAEFIYQCAKEDKWIRQSPIIY